MSFTKFIIITIISLFCFNNNVVYASEVFKNTEKEEFKITVNDVLLNENVKPLNQYQIDKEIEKLKIYRNLSYILPGLGQLLWGDYLQAFIFLSVVVGCIYYFIEGILSGGIQIFTVSIPSIIVYFLIFPFTLIFTEMGFKEKVIEVETSSYFTDNLNKEVVNFYNHENTAMKLKNYYYIPVFSYNINF